MEGHRLVVPQQGHGGTMMRETGKRLSPDYKSPSTGTLICPSQYLPASFFSTEQACWKGCFGWQGSEKLDKKVLLKLRCQRSSSLVPRTGPGLLWNLQHASTVYAFCLLKASLLGGILLIWGVIRYILE